MSKNLKLLTTRMLIIYIITALLFLTSFDLHIHTDEAALAAEHGSAVSISSIDADFLAGADSEEINVGLDGVLKIEHDADSFIAVFLLFTILLSVLQQILIGIIRENNFSCFVVSLSGLPPLRAPPQ
ncbi:MAG: hypothetical protein JKX75_03985 [Gammaproteobacteria bacterium]|nr:hypothetical protein [Gammaproteobacteria bacterium]